jgi:hypothetical protein
VSEFGYIRVTWSGTGVYIRTTHRPVIIDLVHQLRELMPDLAARYTTHVDAEYPHPMDEFRREIELRISQLDARDEFVAFWFVRELGLRGWEIFIVRGNDEYHLRWQGEQEE